MVVVPAVVPVGIIIPVAEIEDPDTAFIVPIVKSRYLNTNKAPIFTIIAIISQSFATPFFLRFLSISRAIK